MSPPGKLKCRGNFFSPTIWPVDRREAKRPFQRSPQSALNMTKSSMKKPPPMGVQTASHTR